MTAPHLSPPRAARPDVAGTPPAHRAAGQPDAVRWIGAALRLSLGGIFLWAFLDKLFSLGRATPDGNGWLEGGSPTRGFLTKGTAGPFKDAYASIAGAGWADALFMAGLLGIGVALLLGVAMRLAAASGALLLVLMWAASLPPATNPFLDYHLVYALVLGLLTLTGAGHTLGLGRRWEALPLVQRLPLLR